MLTPVVESQDQVQSLQGLIGWFNQNSVDLIDEYRRLENRVDTLKAKLAVKNHELESSLQEREQARSYLHSVLESLKGGVLVLDTELKPTFVNRRVTELTGELDDHRVMQLLGERLAASLRCGKTEFLPLECEKIVQTPSGAMIPVHFTVSEVSVGQGSSHYVVVFQDITKLKQLEAEAARSRRLASLGVMASEVAHQVKNPLGGIELYASLLKEKTAGEHRQLADEILNGVQRLSTTLASLLAFAAEPHIAADVLPLPVLMKDLLEHCVPVFDDPLWSIVFAIEPDLPPVWGDRGLLVQALLNFVINGKEAMPNGGRVMVKARFSPFSALNGQIHRAIEIVVSDQGIGILPENRERIFDPFFSTKRQGTGLGLAFAHKVLSAHGGSIELASSPNQGSQFTIALAAAEER
ncbi:MAG TPA: ATP-binding protein [Candidatus Binatia bacterium]